MLFLSIFFISFERRRVQIGNDYIPCWLVGLISFAVELFTHIVLNVMWGFVKLICY